MKKDIDEFEAFGMLVLPFTGEHSPMANLLLLPGMARKRWSGRPENSEK